MATVLTNTQSVVMVEETISVDATLTLTVPSKSSSRHRILKSSRDLMFNFDFMPSGPLLFSPDHHQPVTPCIIITTLQILLSVSLMPMRFEEKLGFTCTADFLCDQQANMRPRHGWSKMKPFIYLFSKSFYFQHNQPNLQCNQPRMHGKARQGSRRLDQDLHSDLHRMLCS